jgi:hypothetical protein
MKYIRYLLYLLLEAGVIGGGIALAHTLRMPVNLSSYKAISGLLSLLFLANLKPIASLVMEIRKPVELGAGVESRYLRQECEYRTRVEDGWKGRVKKMMNGMVLNKQYYFLVYEEDRYLEYESRDMGQEIGSKAGRKKPVRKVLEIEKTEGDRLRIRTYKESRYSELSNRDNEELMMKFLEGMREAYGRDWESPAPQADREQDDRG